MLPTWTTGRPGSPKVKSLTDDVTLPPVASAWEVALNTFGVAGEPAGGGAPNVASAP